MNKLISRGLVGLGLIVVLEGGVGAIALDSKFDSMEYKYQSFVLKSKGDYMGSKRLLKLSYEFDAHFDKLSQLLDKYGPITNLRKYLKSR